MVQEAAHRLQLNTSHHPTRRYIPTHPGLIDPKSRWAVVITSFRLTSSSLSIPTGALSRADGAHSFLSILSLSTTIHAPCPVDETYHRPTDSFNCGSVTFVALHVSVNIHPSAPQFNLPQNEVLWLELVNKLRHRKRTPRRPTSTCLYSVATLCHAQCHNVEALKDGQLISAKVGWTIKVTCP